jgi:beta-galactosidase
VALKLTPVTAPGGLRADGSDVALVDVEAVDARGERCPTVQQRVDFKVSGPATWRGGYNSGKAGSVNNPFLDLEAGVNRVSLRAGRAAGAITLSASSPGLRPASVTLASVPFAAEDGASLTLPATLAAPLPARPPEHAEAAAPPTAGSAGGTAARGMPGRFSRAFTYSGPSSYLVHVETQARDGRNVYVDADLAFVDLPAELVGADWVQAASRESRYEAVDLMELSAVGGSAVWIAHDDRLPRPPWLTRDFQPTSATLTVGGQRMALLKRDVPKDESLTLGANASGAGPSANMYVVFVQGPGTRLAK